SASDLRIGSDADFQRGPWQSLAGCVVEADHVDWWRIAAHVDRDLYRLSRPDEPCDPTLRAFRRVACNGAAGRETGVWFDPLDSAGAGFPFSGVGIRQAGDNIVSSSFHD